MTDIKECSPQSTDVASIDDVTDYIITRLVDAEGSSPEDSSLSQLKLQKLLYYVQAWHLAFHGRVMFQGHFQAWVHGPVNREVFDRFRETKMLYSPITRDDVRPEFNSDTALRSEQRAHINAVLEAYGSLTGDQLETMTHREEPWQEARRGLPPDARCEKEIDETVMGNYYRKRLDP